MSTLSSLKNWLKKHPQLRELVLRFWGMGMRLYPKHLGVPETNIPTVLDFVESLEQRKYYVDLGGGHGPYNSFFRSRFEKAYCVDVVIGKNDIPIMGGDAHAIPIKGNCINFVTAFEVLEHLQKPWVAFQEIARILCKGGRFAMTVPMYGHIHCWPSDYWRYTIHGLRFLAQGAGLRMLLARPMAGPLILLSLVAVNTFGLNNDPFRRVIGVALTWVCYGLELLFFRNPEKMKNPDTRGWLLIAEKS